MMRRKIAALLLPALLLCGCAQGMPDSQTETAPAEETTEYKDKDELVSEWMADETQTEPVTAEAAEDAIDEGATPLDSFEYTIREDGTAAILKYTGKETDVIVTSHIGETPVTEIGQYAFEAKWDVTSVTLPESITKIGEFAFMDCECLTQINIPYEVTALYRGTFAGCTSLTELIVPVSVESVDEELLTGCPLTDLYIESKTLTCTSWGLDAEAPCTIHAPEGAAALTWAESNGFPTEVITAPPAL